MKRTYDVIVAGGGPAGLTCALVLARCLRSVIVFDTGTNRNRFSSALHGFPTRDGEKPAVFLNLVRRELASYGIRVVKKRITGAQKTNTGFRVTTAEGEHFESALLLLSTGLTDRLPAIPGLEKYYGRNVFHCPYCDGYEHRDGSWVVSTSSGKAAVEVCQRLKTWTQDITLLAAYARSIGDTDVRRLRRAGIRVLWTRVEKVSGAMGRLRQLHMENGTILKCDAFFFSAPSMQQSDLARELGCTFNKQGQVRTDRLQQTAVPGLYAAGDMARDMELMVIAAAEGAKAAVAMNTVLNRMRR